METTTLQFYSLEYNRLKTYGVAALFVAGNVLLPQLCHLVHLGGPTFLPIYFFTLVGAYKYGWRVGLLTAVVSPWVNAVLFGMPAMEALPAIVLSPSCWRGLPDIRLPVISVLPCGCWRAWCWLIRRQVRWASG